MLCFFADEAIYSHKRHGDQPVPHSHLSTQVLACQLVLPLCFFILPQVHPHGITSTEALKTLLGAQCQWLKPIILAIQEAEIRKIMVQSQPQANSSQDPILKKSIIKKGLVEGLKW
jgi:hypothetical protein